MAIHIGEKIKQVAKDQGLGATKLGKKLNTTRENVYSIFSRDIIDMPLLLLCCKILHHDFLQYFYDEEPLLGFKNVVNENWQNRFDLLQAELNKVEYLVEVQKELILNQRENIRLLNESRKKENDD